ncbi:MAG: penicillin-binding protein, partial [Propionibacterium sp.]|nr:penicillin-binding protein [Propionibacterium sp.]
MFLAVSLLAGVLLSGVAVPFVAMASGGARTAVATLDYLPAEFETPEQSQRSRILMANGEVLSTFYDENRVYVPLDQISQNMQDAQIAIEDHRFYEHGAIDFEGLGRAFFRTISGDTQGASTLTQQYVKLVRVEAAKIAGDEEAARAAVEVSIERKIQEARYAFAVEEKFTKDEILERYLNIAYYGNGAYGVESAAQQYFGVSAAELELDQAAMLAGLVQNPVGYDPVRNTQRATDRRNLVLQRMADVGFVSQAEADATKQVEFDVEQVTRTPNGCVSSKYPFLCDYVYRRLVSGAVDGLGETREERANTLRRGGLNIYTLIDPKTQDAAQAAVSELVSPTDPVVANSVVLEPSTGLIVAMAQSRPVMGDDIEAGETYFNYNVQGGSTGLGGAEGYQSGSTMKVFALAAALEMGMPVSMQFNAPGRLPLGGEMLETCGEPARIRPDNWAPGNLGLRNYGNIDMKRATDNSVNTYFLQLIMATGNCAPIEMALRLGVERADGGDMRNDAINAS